MGLGQPKRRRFVNAVV